MPRQWKKTESALTCREAQLLLRHIRIDDPVDGYSEEQKAAAKHCVLCKKCPPIDGIVGLKLSCKETLLCVAHLDILESTLHPDLRSLKEALAWEHFNRLYTLSSDGPDHENCVRLRNGLTTGAENQTFCLLEIWYQNRWKLSELFEAMDEYLDRIIERSTPEQLKDKLRAHINALRQAGFQAYES